MIQYKKIDPCLLATAKNGYRVSQRIGVSCPGKCKHCSETEVARYAGDLGTNLNSLVKFGESGVGKLYWDGMEPFTNKDINLYLAVIEHMKSREGASNNLFKRVSIATGGYYITEEIAQHLYDKGLRNVMVSVDGANKKTHDFFRMPSSFDTAVNASKILNKVGYDVRIANTIWIQNVRQLDDIVKLGIDLGAKEVAFNWMQPVGRAKEHPELFVPDAFYQAVAEKIGELKESKASDIIVGYHRGGIADPNAVCRGAIDIAYVAGEFVWPCSWISSVAPEFRSEMTLKDHALTKILEEDPIINNFRQLVEKLSKDGAVCPAMCKAYNDDFDGTGPISEKGIHTVNQKSLEELE